MSKNYDDYKPINPAPPRKRRNPALAFVQYAIIILLVASLMLSGAYFIMLHMNESGKKTPPDNPVFEDNGNDETTADTEETTKPEETPVAPPENTQKYKEIEVGKDQINKGYLILVNAEHKVVYPTADELIDFDGNKPDTYMMSTNGMKANKIAFDPINDLFKAFSDATGKKDVMFWTAFRDEARQAKVYDDYMNGRDDPTAKAGESDHNTGLGIILRARTNGAWRKLTDAEGYSWLVENAYKYGFIERYPADKIDKTGLDYTQRYYIRYVGIPHAEYMKKNNLCLEEYVNILKSFTLGAGLEFTSENGTQYEIYYVNADVEGAVVKIPVPEDKEYSISGNNIDGFIVTVKK